MIKLALLAFALLICASLFVYYRPTIEWTWMR